MRLCDEQTFTHLAALHPICYDSANCLFSASWPACPNFLFQSLSILLFLVLSVIHFLFLTQSLPILPPSFFLPLSVSLRVSLDTVGEDVTFFQCERKATNVFLLVTSTLTEIWKRCLITTTHTLLWHFTASYRGTYTDVLLTWVMKDLQDQTQWGDICRSWRQNTPRLLLVISAFHNTSILKFCEKGIS